MNPTYTCGDTVCVIRFLPKQWFHNGQIIIMEIDQNQYFIKRIVGLPGDVVKINEFELVNKTYKSPYMNFDTDGYIHWSIPMDHYFVKGDDFGIDSRYWGPVHFDSFRGLVLFKLKLKCKCESSEIK